MPAEERDRIPYPIDQSLIAEAQLIGSGQHVHDINRAISYYRASIRRWQENWDAPRWYECMRLERELRGIVAEAKIGRNFHAPWATRGSKT